MKKLICLFVVAASIVSVFADSASAARRRRCKRGGCRVTVDAPLDVVQDSFLR